MALNEANIKAVITAEDKASSVLKGFGDNVNSVAGKVGSVLKTAAEGLAIAGAAAAGFGALTVKAFSESQDLIAQTNAVLKSTGSIAGVTAQQVDELSKSLQKTTRYSDEDVRSVENLLLTFTAVGKDIFPQATTAILDVATALGEDTKSAAIQVGKALQDPVLGITALRRVGVNFNDSQKEVIKNLVETGQKAKAQQLILKELNTEFGGSAVAAGNTFAGSLDKLKNQLNDVEEKIGETIVKYLGPFAQKAAEALSKIDWDRVIRNTIEGIKAFWKELDNAWQALDRVYQQVEKYLEPKLEALEHTIVERLLPAIKDLWDGGLGTLVKKLGTAAGEGLVWAIGAAIDIVNAFIIVMSAVVDWIGKNRWAFDALVAIFGSLAAAMAFNAIVNAFILSMNTIVLVTIPSVVASFQGLIALITGPIVIPALVVAAAVASINTIKQAWYDVLAAQASVESAANTNDATIRQLQQLQKTGTPEQQQRAKITLQKLASTGGFAAGGFTGYGSPNDVAGVVHKGEFVLPQNMVDQSTGTPKVGGGINITIQAGALMGNDVEARKFAQLIMKHYQDAMGRKFGMA